MSQITVIFSNYEEMVDFAKHLLSAPAVQPAPQKAIALPVAAQQIPVSQPIPAQQQAPVQPVPPAQPSAAPVQTSTRAYTLDELARAAMTLMDSGKQIDLQNLLQTFGVEALPALPKEQYGAFATALRGMGANI